ncbi:MAG TPA: two-component regulator propeller domain-containing protein [Saprospiraceae bacterium]|nr:two-component regulator propeller domain-containing protein [Saprospiraceae bacterium]
MRIKKPQLTHTLLPLIFLLFAITSGCTQNLTNSSPQIDEYVVNVFEDKDGNLWFGTLSKGVARYDGKTLTYFSTKDGLCDNTVTGIAQDKKGNMWFGTHAGASRYDASLRQAQDKLSLSTGSKTFTNFRIAEGLHGAGCKILVDRHGTIWAGTNHGAFRFNGRIFSEFDIPEPAIEKLSYKWEAGKVWNLYEDSKGNIWFGRDGFGACKFDGKAFTHFTTKDGLCSNNVANIAEDKHGNIWFGCISSDFPEYIDEGGLNRYDGATFTKYPEMESLTENDIYAVYDDKAGDIWIGAVGYGAYHYDGREFKVFRETDRPDLTMNFGVQGFLEDRNGTLWFGFSGGLFRFNGESFINVTQDGPWK